MLTRTSPALPRWAKLGRPCSGLYFAGTTHLPSRYEFSRNPKPCDCLTAEHTRLDRFRSLDEQVLPGLSRLCRWHRPHRTKIRWEAALGPALL